MVHQVRGRFALAHLVLAVTAATMTQAVSAQQMSMFEGPAKQSSPQPDPLHDVIVSTIFPETWDFVGGPSHIRIVDSWGVAVITATPETHSHIESLLSIIRQVRQQQDEEASLPEATTRVRLVENAADISARERIEAALSSETEIDFVDAPLSEVVAYLRDLHGIPIVLDRTALEDIGLSEDDPITMQLSKVSLRSALKLALKNPGLTYNIKNEVLQITTPEVVEQELTTRVYPVRDLLVKSEAPESAAGTAAVRQ